MVAKLRAVIMIEAEVDAAGGRDLNRIQGLDHQLEAVPGLRCAVDDNHDTVHLERDESNVTFHGIRGIFLKLGFEPRSVGAIPPERRLRTKMQRLSA